GILDVTIAYPGGRPSMVDLMSGRVREVRVSVRVRPLPTDVPRAGDESDRATRARFQQWLNALWEEKDMEMARLLGQGGAPALLPGAGPASCVGVRRAVSFGGDDVAVLLAAGACYALRDP